MAASTEAELIRLTEGLHFGQEDSTLVINLFNSRMREIRAAGCSVPQLREQILSAASLQEMNKLLEGRCFSPEEASSLQGIINRKRAEFLGCAEGLSHQAVPNLAKLRKNIQLIII